MISVARDSKPDGFAAQADKWRDEFERRQKDDSTYTSSKFWKSVRKRKAMKRYAEALGVTFYHKCAFCESKVKHVSPEQVEHYRPKSRPEFVGLMFAWENWLVSCERCNTKKGVKFPYCADNQPCFIDPASEDPSEHIDFLEAHMLEKTERGKITIEEIGLQRSDLVEFRTLWLRVMIDPLLLLLLCGIPEAKSEARSLLIWSMQADAPYTAMTQAYLNKKTPKLAEPETPHPFIEICEPLQRIKQLVKKYQTQIQEVI